MKYLFSLLALFSFTALQANNVEITNLVQSGSTITFDISWENSWKQGSLYRDAVWIFIKQQPNGGPSWQHVDINSAVPKVGFTQLISADPKGIMLERLFNLDGTATTDISLTTSGLIGQFQDIKVMAVEMVYIPPVTFFAGDGTSAFRIAEGDDATRPVRINSNDALTCSTSNTDIQFVNGTCLDIPADFPEHFY